MPYFIRKMQHSAAKRAFAFGFLLRINQGSEEVPVTLKQVLVAAAIDVHDMFAVCCGVMAYCMTFYWNVDVGTP